MIGFIRKDLVLIRSNLKALGILFVIYVVMGVAGKMDISILLPFMSLMIMVATFSYDSFNKWDAYCISLPNGRKNSVTAKYLATLLSILAVMVIITLFSFVISYIRTGTFDHADILIAILKTALGTIIAQSFLYPIIFKFGIEKARIYILVILFAVVVIGGFVIKYIDFRNIIKLFLSLRDYWVPVLILSAAVLLYVSYLISLKIQLKKEY